MDQTIMCVKILIILFSASQMDHRSILKFETLPEHLIQRILECFQTKKLITINDVTDYEKQQLITKRRRNLINGKGIKTDLKSILTFSMTCKKFNYIVRRSDIGKLLLTVHYNSKELDIANKLEHISYCHDENCRNVCHYVNKDTKHSNIIKKVALQQFNEQKKNKLIDKEQLVEKFRPFLTDKQIANVHVVNKKEIPKVNETSKFSESPELDSF